MKRILRCTAAASFLLLPAVAFAADLGFYGTSLLRLEKDAVPGFDKQTLAPATQFLGLDLDRIGDGNLSLHLYGWERVDLAGKSTEDGSREGDLDYAYLQYRFPRANALIKAGRFYLHEGIAAEQLDGVSARADLVKGFALSVFGGAPVRLDRPGDNKGDYLVGGRLSYRLANRLELGASALREGGVESGPSADLRHYRQLAGVDLWLYPHRMIEFRGRSFYNTATDGMAEQSYLVTFRPLPPLSISGEYSDQRFRDYFSTTNLRSLFNTDTNGKQKAYGAFVSYAATPRFEVTGDYKRYNRTSESGSDSNGNFTRYGGEARLTLLHSTFRSAVSYHRLETADSSPNPPIGPYHEARGYGVYDASRCLTSLDAIFHFYDQSIYKKKRAYELIASLGYKFFPDLVLSGDLSYGKNPLLDDELRGVLRLTFNYAAKGAIR